MKHISWTLRITMTLLTTIMLVSSVASYSLAAPKKVTKKAPTEQKAGQDNQKEQASVQAASLLAVVTGVSQFDFAQDFYFLPPPVFLRIATVSIPKQAEGFYYFFSFFRNVFGHHIAINAP